MKNTIFIIFLFSSGIVLGQRADVKGFVFDAKSGEAVPFSVIQIAGTALGATTDQNGFYTIPNVPQGSCKLVARCVGFEDIIRDIDVPSAGVVNITFTLKEKSILLQDIEVNAEKQKQITETRVSVTTITPMELKRIPTIGGEPDLAQYLQVLPGVISTGDQGGQIVIRGGTPIQTKFLLDGMVIYNPFHSIGIFSVFETELVKNVDVYTGGVPARFGGRISAVVDVTTRDGNRKKVSGRFSASPFLAKAILEIPIIKFKEDRRNSASLMLSTKISYLNQTSKILYPWSGQQGLPYRFYDVYGKFSANLGSNKLNLSGFNFIDFATFDEAQYRWDSYGFAGNFMAAPRNSNIYFNTYVNYSKYSISLEEKGAYAPRNSSIGGFDIGLDFTSFIRNGDIKYGLNVMGFTTTFDFRNSFNQKIDQDQNTTDFSAYFQYHQVFKKRFVLDVGGRIQYYGNITGLSPEGRISLKYNATSWIRFKVAGGNYSQNFLSTKSDRDVVSLFNGFLTSPEETYRYDPSAEPVKRNIQRAVDVVGGIELQLPANVFFNLEGYYKYYSTLFNINRFKQFNQDPNFIVEKGAVYGLDVLGRWEFKKFFLHIAYSLAWSTRNAWNPIAGVEVTYPPSFDRRHNLNVVASYTFGKKLDWELSLRWNLGTGFPFTRTQAFYESVNFGQGGIGTNYLNQNGNLQLIYEQDYNKGRLPIYHRMDLGAKKIFSIKDLVRIELGAALSNVYNRNNIFYINRITQDKVYQLPIIPSMHLTVSF